MLNLLFYQGGWICSAASAALPFMLRLAASPQVPSRCAMLELVAMLAAEAGRVEARFLDPGWASAWERALSKLLRLLDDAEPEIRRATADVLGVCGSPGELILPGLLRSWKTEDDPVTRLELVLSLGHAALRAPAGARRAEVFGLLDAPQPQIHLAALHALAPTDPGLPAAAGPRARSGPGPERRAMAPHQFGADRNTGCLPLDLGTDHRARPRLHARSPGRPSR